jgi:uroporphyrinogen decarboxylase
MTSRKRLIKVLNREIPDHVPVAPDTSNMIPAKLTGKPFWQLYLYQDPPIWLAYINCVKHFGFDSLMDGYVPIDFEDMALQSGGNDKRETFIVYRSEERIVTQGYRTANGKRFWDEGVNVYYRDNPPSWGVDPLKINLPKEPASFEPVRGVKEWPRGAELLSLAKREMGDCGLVGVVCGTTKLVHTEEDIYSFHDDPGPFIERRDTLLDFYERKLNRLLSLEDKPDFICVGGSGTLIHQTVETFRLLGLPIVQKITGLCKSASMPTHVHSCGPEKELVKILAEETDLTVIDPLEIPPMGDCDLKELKILYGGKLVLKGNLHTTNVMLNGSAEAVIDASKKAIDDAAEGGSFILSTGDQCGRDTPEENLFAMIETAKTYGKY